MMIHGDEASGILDFSSGRQTLTSSGASVSNAITPRYGSYSIETSTTTDYISWPNKIAEASYSTPVTIDMFVYFPTAPTASTWQIFANEITSTSAPSIGDWSITWYDSIALRRFTGSGLYQSRIAVVMSFTGATWYHLFAQDNGDGTMTIGWGTPGSSSTGTGTNAAVGQINTQTPVNARKAVGAGAGYDNSNKGFYFQQFRYMKGVALFPSSGTYKIPVMRYGV
jgi:hypothetical protein